MRGEGSGTGRTLLVCDLDGTLLRPDATLSTTTVRVVNEFIARGGMFTYATARSFTTAARATAPLDLRLPVITYGGAIVVDPRTGRARPARTLAGDVLTEVLAATDRSPLVQPIVFAVHRGRDRLCWLADRTTPAVDDFLRARPGDPRLLPLASWSAIDPASAFYICLIGPRAPIGDLHDRLAGLRTRCSCVLAQDIYPPRHWLLELTAPEATKAAAVTALRRELAAGTLVCFGDNHNDLPMFAVADSALAVANAAADVKTAATEVIGANTADGVATWIRRHIGSLI